LILPYGRVRGVCERTISNPENAYLGREWFPLVDSATHCIGVTWAKISPAKSKSNDLFTAYEDDHALVGSEARADSTVSEVTDGTFNRWLEREVLLSTTNWVDGATFFLQDPVLASLVFGSSTINSRMRNYSNFRFDAIKLRVVVNATPFRSGILMGSFTPLTSRGSAGTFGTTSQGECPYFSGGVSEVEQGVVVPGCATTDFNYVVQRSQRNPVFSAVSKSEGFEYEIPWRHYRDSIVIDNNWPGVGATANFANQFYNFGYFTLESLGVPLRSGNATTTPVTVLVYARFVNPRVWGPTFATQSGTLATADVQNVQGASHSAGSGTPPVSLPASKDERVQTVKPSEIASAVGEAAAIFGKFPVVGFWATATSIAAQVVASVLRFFGWSNPPIIEGRRGMQLYSNVHTVNPLISRQDDVVALDPRNETTVDPRLTGGPGVDELVISRWCARPTVLDIVRYNVADNPGQLLLSIPVSPNHSYLTFVNNTASGSIPCVRSTMLPYTYAAQAFDLWRGRFCIRLTPIVSAFHKGSIKIWWDPIGYGTTNQIGLQTTTIHEIADGPIEFKVDFAAAVGYLSVDSSPINTATSAAVNAISYWGNRAAAVPLVSDNLTRYFNGVVNVQTLNRLQGESDVSIMVQTWFEDMQFAVPRCDVDVAKGTINQVSVTNFVTQSGTLDVATVGNDDHLPLLYTGERVLSLRTLFNRSSIWRVLELHLGTGGTTVLNGYDFPRFPLARGAIVKDLNSSTRYFKDDTYGTYSTQGTLVSNWCNTTPIAYFSRCFVGHRGSVVWRAQVFDGSNGDAGCISTLSRGNVRTGNNVWGRFQQGFTASVNNGTLLMQRLLGSGSGGILNCTSVDRIVGGVFPSYFKYRMMGADSNHYLDATVISGAEWDTNMYNNEKMRFLQCGTSGVTKYVTLCCAAGPDFTPLEFVSCPDVYVANVTYPSP